MIQMLDTRIFNLALNILRRASITSPVAEYPDPKHIAVATTLREVYTIKFMIAQVVRYVE